MQHLQAKSSSRRAGPTSTRFLPRGIHARVLPLKLQNSESRAGRHKGRTCEMSQPPHPARAEHPEGKGLQNSPSLPTGCQHSSRGSKHRCQCLHTSNGSQLLFLPAVHITHLSPAPFPLFCSHKLPETNQMELTFAHGLLPPSRANRLNTSSACSLLFQAER